MEQAYCTAVFWRGGEKIDLKGLKPNEVRCLTVSGEKITDLAFLSEYPNLEMLTLDGNFQGWKRFQIWNSLMSYHCGFLSLSTGRMFIFQLFALCIYVEKRTEMLAFCFQT